MNIFLTFLISIFTLEIYAQDLDNGEAVDLLDRIDKMYFASSSHARINLTIKRPTFERNIALELHSQGDYNVFVKILSPGEQEGKSVLKVGKELFFFEPKEKKVVHISQTGALRRFLLSEFSRDDFLNINRLSEEYHVNQVEAGPYLTLTLTPKMITPIVWDKIVFKIQKSDSIPVSKSYYNEKGAKEKELFYKDIKEIAGVLVPTTLEMKSYTNPGFISKLEYRELDLNTHVFPHLFTMKNLKNEIDYGDEAPAH